MWLPHRFSLSEINKTTISQGINVNGSKKYAHFITGESEKCINIGFVQGDNEFRQQDIEGETLCLLLTLQSRAICSRHNKTISPMSHIFIHTPHDAQE
ncbi:hypothetical protein [Kluyvera intermedia]|uniref:hypothetical protein n=1 Tax=Kluyvera intermedia TaxID=61648 RepID=UPI003524514F